MLWRGSGSEADQGNGEAGLASCAPRAPFAALARHGYQAIVADPPWAFSSNSKAKPGRNAMRHYDCMTVPEICALPVADLTAPDCLLFLWITGPFLAIGAHLKVFKAWGFKPSGMGFTWIKLKKNSGTLFVMPKVDTHKGTGFTTRKNAEWIVIGRKGKTGHLRKSKNIDEVLIAPIREHSRKPREIMERIVAYMGPDARIAELFSRETYPGVDAWGNEAGKFDAR